MADNSTSNKLVVYSQKDLDLSRYVQTLQKPISSINPEARIVSNGYMYTGGFYDIRFDEQGIRGKAYVRFLQVWHKKNLEDLTFCEQLSRTLFGVGSVLELFDNIMHEDKKYVEHWRITVGERFRSDSELLFYKNQLDENLLYQEFIPKLKNAIINEHSTVLSNELLIEIFEPISIPLIQAYKQMAKF